MVKNFMVGSAIFLTLLSSTALAGSIPTPTSITTGAASQTDTKAYLGLNWTLGGGTTPALVLGVFNTKVKSNGDTTGANLAFHVKFAGGLAPGKIKLSYLNGSENLQGELGLGYDFVRSSPLAFLGLNAPYVAAGVDAYANPGLVPYVTLHTQGKFDKPTGSITTFSCPAGFTFNAISTTCEFID